MPKDAIPKLKRRKDTWNEGRLSYKQTQNRAEIKNIVKNFVTQPPDWSVFSNFYQVSNLQDKEFKNVFYQ